MALLQISQSLSHFKKLLILLHHQFIIDIANAQGLCQPSAEKAFEFIASDQILHPAIEGIVKHLFMQSAFLIAPQKWENFKKHLEEKIADPDKYTDSQITLSLRRVFLSKHEIEKRITSNKKEIEILSGHSIKLEKAMLTMLHEFLKSKHSSEYGSNYSQTPSIWLWLLGKPHQGLLDAAISTDYRVENPTETCNLTNDEERNITNIFLNLIFFHTQDIEKINLNNSEAYLLRSLISFHYATDHLLALRLIQNLTLDESSLSDIDTKISITDCDCNETFTEIKKLLINISKIKEMYSKKNPPTELDERKYFEASKLILQHMERSLYKLLLMARVFLEYLKNILSTDPLISLYNEAITPATKGMKDSHFIQKLSEYDEATLKNLLKQIKKELCFFPKDDFDSNDLDRNIIHWWSHCIEAIEKASEEQPKSASTLPRKSLVSCLFPQPKEDNKCCHSTPCTPRH